jgi:transposase
MAFNLRAFGTIISGNRQFNHELTSETRAAICAAVACGQTHREVAEAFRVSKTAVTKAIQHFKQHGTFNSKARSGRKPKLTRREKRYIYKLVRKFPKMAFKALILEVNSKISFSTIKRVLRTYHLRKWKSMKRIMLTKEGATERYNFVRYWLDLHYPERLQKLVSGKFSDECTLQNNTNNPVGWIFRFPSEKWLPDFVNIQNHGKANISIMVWAMIWVGGRSEIMVMERDSDSSHNGYTSKSYQIALKDGLLPYYEAGDLFQQDNAKIHVSDSSKYWFEQHGIWVIDWPAHSPDLNPIEHVWKALKAEMYKKFPNLYALKRNELDIAKFKEMLRIAWNAIPQELIDRLINSIPRRLKAVRKAKGWYTKY